MAFALSLHTASELSPEELFTRSLSIDAHLASMSKSEETAIAGTTSGSIQFGETVTWRARHFGIWWTMTSKITELDAPKKFVDQQHRGPFKSFRHEHSFESTPAGSLMTDLIEVTAPLGPLGLLAEKLFLKSYLKRLIEERNQFLLSSPPQASGSCP
ncbi:ligand-binding SRPBCC domain-containing protein [Psychromicrobium silvestre]|uniref:Ligand-binding SRPBCC domain-containing protein n=1 Tax=Psychromicrobium silvestre TaxID=1645614 RepID=A0A7Y9LR01_9MICC|nr:SRPBCC family protein [Psychromicrobium silvestre]NYE94000.1 ligand-binding SRPBCC domain-containing protein [Psychromicrobium silvestre]